MRVVLQPLLDYEWKFSAIEECVCKVFFYIIQILSMLWAGADPYVTRVGLPLENGSYILKYIKIRAACSSFLYIGIKPRIFLFV